MIDLPKAVALLNITQLSKEGLKILKEFNLLWEHQFYRELRIQITLRFHMPCMNKYSKLNVLLSCKVTPDVLDQLYIDLSEIIN